MRTLIQRNSSFVQTPRRRLLPGLYLLLLLSCTAVGWLLRKNPPEFVHHYYFAAWISTQRMLIVRDTSEDHSPAIVSRNIMTGDEQILGSMPYLDCTSASSWSWTVSPDGKTFLWDKQSDSGVVWTAMTLDSSRPLVQWPGARYADSRPDRPSMAVWMADSRRWMEVTLRRRGVSVIVHDLVRPEVPRQIEIPYIINVSSVLGVTPAGHLLFTTDYESARKTHLVDVNLNTAPPTHAFPGVELPMGIVVCDQALSPDGERMAWTIGNAHYISIWISSLKTGDAAPLCTQSDTLSTQMDGSEIQNLLWTPDGKSVSFWWNQKLHIVSLADGKLNTFSLPGYIDYNDGH